MTARPSPWSLFVAASSAMVAACGDDTAGTGGAGGAASTSASSATSSGSPTSTTATDAASSSGGEQGGGDAGGGDQGGGDQGGGGPGGGGAGGEAPACTADEPPASPCDEKGDVGQTCAVDVVGGGCPDTTVVWRCTDFEGGPTWNQSIDTGCACSLENDEEACTALPGCVWAEAPGDTCDEFTFDGVAIGETGCFREDCGSPGAGLVGLVDGACQDDLCTAFPPD